MRPGLSFYLWVAGILCVTSVCSKSVWQFAYENGVYDDVCFLDPIYDEQRRHYFVGVFFKNKNSIKGNAALQECVRPSFDWLKVHCDEVSRCYGVLGNARIEADFDFFNQSHVQKMFSFDPQRIEPLDFDFTLSRDEESFIITLLRDSGYQSIPLEKIEVCSSLEFRSLHIINKTRLVVLLVPSRTLYDSGAKYAYFIQPQGDKMVSFKSIKRFVQSDSGKIELSDFYDFDNHFLAFFLDEYSTTRDIKTFAINKKIIFRIAVTFRHIELEQGEGGFSLDMS